MGKVYLVGAGCGQYQLITVRGKSLLEKADCVIYDRLIDPMLLNYCKEKTELIYLGKGNTEGGTLQERINKTLVDKAKEHAVVVRLKGGDSFVFGRGGEEIGALIDEGIPFEMVPGISSSLAAPEYAGIPVTHRGISRSFHVFTAHFSKPSMMLDFEAIAPLEGTLIFLMGVGNLDKIVNGLIKAGKDKQTPIALVEKGGRTKQRTITGTLDTIINIAKVEEVEPPAVIVIGEVVDLRNDFGWFSKLPLYGKKVLVTRAKGQEQSLIQGVYDFGGEGIHLPLLDITYSLPEIQLNQYKYILFNSPNGVHSFFHQITDVRILGDKKIGAVGIKTKEALLKYRITPDIMPEVYVSDVLIKETIKASNSNEEILVITSDQSPLHKVNFQEAYGKTVHVITSHTTSAIEYTRDEMIEILKDMDIVTFLSGSSVESFHNCLKGDYSGLEHLHYASIGPKTSQRIVAHGLKVAIEAKEYTVEGLLEAMTCLNEQDR
ncbi:uroporphyrinogen-III C-methyltransferase [Vallitalea okinawensis]|uniref:uroporphyrinogen-III C-methyltransferase n=1 Tax=Vallitalea okinawensis TaxID=2078660 RepID=UPI000CFC1AA8|nr:uroporphyrinogen-III C-methyltransferase [Vallitalea okinawensis]